MLGCVAVLLALAACGGASSTNWTDVGRVTVTVSRPGLPPPGGAPRTATFTSQAELARATAALNAQHITKTSGSTSSASCAGGEQIAITIAHTNGSTTHLAAYQCAGQTYGDVGGQLTKLLSALGVSPDS